MGYRDEIRRGAGEGEWTGPDGHLLPHAAQNLNEFAAAIGYPPFPAAERWHEPRRAARAPTRRTTPATIWWVGLLRRNGDNAAPDGDGVGALLRRLAREDADTQEPRTPAPLPPAFEAPGEIASRLRELHAGRGLLQFTTLDHEAMTEVPDIRTTQGVLHSRGWTLWQYPLGASSAAKESPDFIWKPPDWPRFWQSRLGGITRRAGVVLEAITAAKADGFRFGEPGRPPHYPSPLEIYLQYYDNLQNAALAEIEKALTGGLPEEAAVALRAQVRAVQESVRYIFGVFGGNPLEPWQTDRWDRRPGANSTPLVPRRTDGPPTPVQAAAPGRAGGIALLPGAYQVREDSAAPTAWFNFRLPSNIPLPGPRATMQIFQPAGYHSHGRDALRLRAVTLQIGKPETAHHRQNHFYAWRWYEEKLADGTPIIPTSEVWRRDVVNVYAAGNTVLSGQPFTFWHAGSTEERENRELRYQWFSQPMNEALAGALFLPIEWRNGLMEFVLRTGHFPTWPFPPFGWHNLAPLPYVQVKLRVEGAPPWMKTRPPQDGRLLVENQAVSQDSLWPEAAWQLDFRARPLHPRPVDSGLFAVECFGDAPARAGDYFYSLLYESERGFDRARSGGALARWTLRTPSYVTVLDGNRAGETPHPPSADDPPAIPDNALWPLQFPPLAWGLQFRGGVPGQPPADRAPLISLGWAPPRLPLPVRSPWETADGYRAAAYPPPRAGESQLGQPSSYDGYGEMARLFNDYWYRQVQAAYADWAAQQEDEGAGGE